MAFPRRVMGLYVVCDVVFLDQSHLLFLLSLFMIINRKCNNSYAL